MVEQRDTTGLPPPPHNTTPTAAIPAPHPAQFRPIHPIRPCSSIPISANLAAWLAPLRRGGRVVPSCRQHREITALAKSLGIPWPRNVLRHSFISYRIAIVKSADQVALREPVEKPGPGARRVISPHSEARRRRR